MSLHAHTSYMLAVLKYLIAYNSAQATKHVLWPYVCKTIDNTQVTIQRYLCFKKDSFYQQNNQAFTSIN